MNKKNVTPVRAFVSHLKVLMDKETKEAISGVVREPDLSPLGSPHSWLLLDQIRKISCAAKKQVKIQAHSAEKVLYHLKILNAPKFRRPFCAQLPKLHNGKISLSKPSPVMP